MPHEHPPDRLTKAAFEAAAAPLREKLLAAQFALRDAGGTVLLVLAGDDGPGCNDAFDRLREWLDPRFLMNQAMLRRSDEERERPWLWRYWRALPPAGQIAVFFGGWAGEILRRAVRGRLSEKALAQRVAHVTALERALVADDAALVKCWLHISRRELRRRRAACRDGDYDDGFYRKRDMQRHAEYGAARDRVVQILHGTSLPEAPWRVIDTADRRQRDLTIGAALLEALEDRVQAAKTAAAAGSAAPRAAPATAAGARNVPKAASSGPLAAVDLSQRLDPALYEDEVEELQVRIGRLSGRARRRKRATILVFEGWDAAGKGGAVRRLTAAMEASDYRVHPIAAPTDEERGQHYLWRFWRLLPRAGQVCIFDRSWYGRVLVERVEQFAPEDAWRRAYGEINDFEAQLVERGCRLAKFWLHISPEAQLARFDARTDTPSKQFKIGADDWRNRAKWSEYEAAVNEMVERTSVAAPWRLIAANDKYFARIEVLRQVAELLGSAK